MTAARNRCTSAVGKRALVASTDIIAADILLKTLKVASFGSVRVVETVRQVMDELDWAGEPVDLVITGLTLNDGDGFELIEILAEKNYAGEILFVDSGPARMLTCATDLAETRSLRVIGHFQRPVAIRTLVATLEEKLLSRRRAEDDRIELSEESLDRDLHSWRIEPVFQPKVSLITDEVAGFEALARWNHPRHGLLPPSYFLSRAEQNCLIDDLTEAVLRKSLKVLNECHRERPQLSMSVNLSGVSLGKRELPERLREIVGEAGVRPARVRFEVTETQMLRDKSAALLNIDRLALMGFGISLDDFGTGYSSPSRLRSLPISELKVDRQFCDGAARRKRLQRILRNCVDLGRDLGLNVVAEGVETKEDRVLMRELGFHLVQGFVESPPRTRRQLLDWLDGPAESPLRKIA